MKIKDIMTPDVQCVQSGDNLIEAASLMRQLDVGALPVCENDSVAGMITDRDIVLRCVAEGLDPKKLLVKETMSPGIVYVFDDQDVDDAVRVMEKHQVRRAPVMNRENRLVGIVSLGDIAVDGSMSLGGEALKDISQPSEPVR